MARPTFSLMLTYLDQKHYNVWNQKQHKHVIDYDFDYDCALFIPNLHFDVSHKHHHFVATSYSNNVSITHTPHVLLCNDTP